MQGMAAQDSLDAHEGSFDRSINFYCLNGIFGTGRMEAAAWRKEER